MCSPESVALQSSSFSIFGHSKSVHFPASKEVENENDDEDEDEDDWEGTYIALSTYGGAPDVLTVDVAQVLWSRWDHPDEGLKIVFEMSKLQTVPEEHRLYRRICAKDHKDHKELRG